MGRLFCCTDSGIYLTLLLDIISAGREVHGMKKKAKRRRGTKSPAYTDAQFIKDCQEIVAISKHVRKLMRNDTSLLAKEMAMHGTPITSEVMCGMLADLHGGKLRKNKSCI